LVSLAKSRVVVTEKVGLRAVELEGLGFKAYDAHPSRNSGYIDYSNPLSKS